MCSLCLDFVVKGNCEFTVSVAVIKTFHLSRWRFIFYHMVYMHIFYLDRLTDRHIYLINSEQVDKLKIIHYNWSRRLPLRHKHATLIWEPSYNKIVKGNSNNLGLKRSLSGCTKPNMHFFMTLSSVLPRPFLQGAAPYPFLVTPC